MHNEQRTTNNEQRTTNNEQRATSNMQSKTTTVPAQLLRLEQLDTQLEQQESSLTELRNSQRRNPELATAETQLARLQKDEAAAATQQRSLEADLSTLQSKIARDNTRMFSGQIVDSRELGSLEKELAHLRAQRSDVEERLLDVMQTVETLQSELVAAGTKVEETRSRWDTDRPETEVRITRLTDELQDLRAERESLAAELDPRSIDMYQRLRKASGHAVSAVSGGICQWCRVAIPSKDLQHARAGALVACNNCARILYIAG
jgi:uncharacterized protein